MLIQSEIGRLKKVLVHRPYYSLTRLTPGNCKEFLFDDVLWPEKAEEEHKIFTGLLEQEGVEVLFIHNLLSQAIKNPVAKKYLIEQYLYSTYYGSYVEDYLIEYLNSLDNDALVAQIFSGITHYDLPPHSLGLLSLVSKEKDFIMPPLTNQLFTRDSSVWIDDGVCLTRMAFGPRKLETVVLSTIYRYHPLFIAEEFPIWYAGDDPKEILPSIEGGDVMVLSDKALVIGISQRTQPQAIELLAKNLFKAGKIQEIVAVNLPKKRSCMHLDTILTMVDYDAFCSYYPELVFDCWSITPGKLDTEVNISKQENLSSTLARLLGIKKIRIFSSEGDPFALEREQWTDSANMFAIRPGVVFAYEQNYQANKHLKNMGIETITFPASELSRGRGGSRCMTCPLERELL